ncbi:MAG: tetratricopeptide repeat protein [Armatimonadota bacterium]|nr:tetratricopeptide repeat protein [Armatimonadota bacterium]MDR7422333.1 tetratricopeptide repeat protein [Armatimonadota bacterium]MDR7453800.1 tetratricopeptide repeat protein [Armatimonadota bacterium]MDR7455949.1 tetratricopeptide repeat protein [Armatimonadota bacterium]MDR7496180.1 tetratricopeptide repeat protein [Armatimonadota bacterium]
MTDPRRRAHRAVAVLLAGAAVALGVLPAGAQGTGAEWPALVQRYEAAVQRNPADPDAHFTLAMLYARDGRLLDGWKHLQEADRAVGLARRAAMARQVAAEAQALLRRNSGDLLARYRLAFATYVLGDHAAVAAEFERITAADPRNDWGFGYLGQAYATLGRDDRAIAAWQRGLQINPDNAVLHYVLALAYTRQGDRRAAARHLAAAYRDRTLYDYVTGHRR